MKLSILILALLTFVVASVYAAKGPVATCVNQGQVALTYDDGPAGASTLKLLDVLKSKGAKATFHISAQWLSDGSVAAVVMRCISEGHLIGLRINTALNFTIATVDDVKAAVQTDLGKMKEHIGITPTFIRLPVGIRIADNITEVIESLGFTITTPSIDSQDYVATNDIITPFRSSLIQGGAGSFIAVQRDAAASAAAQTGALIDFIKATGYKVARLDECMGIYTPQAPVKNSAHSSLSQVVGAITGGLVIAGAIAGAAIAF